MTMNRIGTHTLLATILLTSTPAMAQQKQPTEAQCREAVNTMMQMMKSPPVEKEKDRQRAKEVIERAEKIVRDNRARGASECESWAAIGKIVVNQ
jgi:transposase